MINQPNQIYEFGQYRLEVAEQRLLRNGEIIPLQPKAFELLLVMVKNHGHLLEKDELLQTIWPDAIVEEVNLANNISVLRKALGEGENGQRFIETAPRRGYRFVAGVKEVEGEGGQSEMNRRASSTIDSSPPGISRGIGQRRRLAALLITLILIGIAGATVLWYLKRPSAAPSRRIKSIAVLPFKPLVAGVRDEAMELGMADTLITKLSSLRQIVVRPTSAVRRYTALDQDPLAAGREQRVESVLESSYHWTGDKIRVTVRLLQVSDGTSLWSYQCDAYCNDIFTAQDIISEKVAQSLKVGLSGDERGRLAKHYTENKEAYQLYQKGIFYRSKRTGESIKNSIEYFKQAVEKDPAYTLAFIGLASAYSGLPNYGGGSQEDLFPKAQAAAERAVELDPALAESYVALANIHYLKWNLSESNRELQQALSLNPNCINAHHAYGRRNLLVMRRYDEAIAHLERAQELDPLSLIISADIGTFYFWEGQYDKAIDQLQKTLEMDQNFYPARRYLGRSYEMKGLIQEALAEYRKAYELNNDPVVLAYIGHVYGISGKRKEAMEILDQVKEISKQRDYSSFAIAFIFMGLGEKEQVFQYLEKAYREHRFEMTHLTYEPYFAAIRFDPRYLDLVRRVGMP